MCVVQNLSYYIIRSNLKSLSQPSLSHWISLFPPNLSSKCLLIHFSSQTWAILQFLEKGKHVAILGLYSYYPFSLEFSFHRDEHSSLFDFIQVLAHMSSDMASCSSRSKKLSPHHHFPSVSVPYSIFLRGICLSYYRYVYFLPPSLECELQESRVFFCLVL